MKKSLAYHLGEYGRKLFENIVIAYHPECEFSKTITLPENIIKNCLLNLNRVIKYSKQDYHSKIPFIWTAH